MELKSLLIYSILLSSIKYLLFHTVITFIPKSRIILKLVDLTFSTLVLIVNFRFVSSISFVDALSMKRISVSDSPLQCHIPVDPELMKGLIVFVLSDFLNRIFQLSNNFPRCNFELVKSLLFIYFIVEGFFINQVGIVLLLGIIQNLVSMLKYFCQFSRTQKGILIRINLIFLIIFWLYSFLLVIPFHSFYQILRLRCDEVADYRLKLFSVAFLSYYIIEMYLNPVAEYRRFLEREFFIIPKILKLHSFVKKDEKSNAAELEESKTEAKTYLMRSSKNTKNQVMMMQMIRCVMSLKKKAKRIKEKNKSEDKENDVNS